MSFSKRNGYLPAKKAIRRESLDEETRNGLWNVILLLLKDRHIADQGKLIDLYRAIWIDFFKQRDDLFTTPRSCAYNSLIEMRVFKECETFWRGAKWNECFDFLEFIVEYVEGKQLVTPNFNGHTEETGFVDIITSRANKVLEEESSAYRFVGNRIVEIISESERQEIDEAIDKSNDPVQEHLKKALDFLADRTKPDYQNSVKESISAVESLCRIVLHDPKPTLGKAIKSIEQKYHLHPALVSALEKLYGFTSDSGGIRHGSVDLADVDYALAKYMLVSCSAFINYLICKSN